FDSFLKGEDNGMRGAAPVRLEIRSCAHEVHAVRDERGWPPPGVRWSSLHLAPGELRTAPVDTRATVPFEVPDGGASFVFRADEDLDLVGPMKLRLHVALEGASDAHLFVAVSKIADGTRGTTAE